MNNINKTKLINCIMKEMQKENNYLDNCGKELLKKGVVVIDLHINKENHDFIHKTNWLEEIKNIQLRDFKTTEPTYGFVLGAFGALGNPASFHNELLYRLRYVLFQKISGMFGLMDNTKNLECLFDRVAIRRKGTDISAESWHRDTCSVKQDSDVIYGGWINLDSTETQYFSCVPGTHMCSGRGGFEAIKDQIFSKVKIEVKPKQVIIFSQNIIHEIYKQKIKNTNIRLYLGWRHTKSEIPVFNDDKNEQYNIWSILNKQLVPALPSGDLPFMYTRNHPRLFKSRLETLTAEIKNFYVEQNNKYSNNMVVKRSLKEPINLVNIPNEYKLIYFPNKRFYIRSSS